MKNGASDMLFKAREEIEPAELFALLERQLDEELPDLFGEPDVGDSLKRHIMSYLFLIEQQHLFMSL